VWSCRRPKDIDLQTKTSSFTRSESLASLIGTLKWLLSEVVRRRNRCYLHILSHLHSRLNRAGMARCSELKEVRVYSRD